MSNKRLSLEVQNLTKIYKDKKHNNKVIFENQNITFECGKIHCLLGESGCGKSTLLRIIAGLEKYDNGNITTFNSDEFRFSMILQDNNLLPWLSAYQNIEFAIKSNKYDIDKSNIDKLLDEYGILNFLKKFPYEMSVGMKQKVSFAKAMVINPNLVLLDEPFSALVLV